MLEDQNLSLEDYKIKLKKNDEEIGNRERRWRRKLEEAAAIAEEVFHQIFLIHRLYIFLYIHINLSM